MKKFFTTLLFIFAGLFLNAQIVYTDVNPDLAFGIDQSYFLDINNDGTSDYQIKQLDSIVVDSLEGVELISLYNNDAVFVNSFMDFLDALTYGTLIDASLPYQAGVLPAGGIIYINNTPYPQGPWITGNDYYMGLRFQVATNTFYGWCRMSVGTDGLSFIIKDYAYSTSAEAPIIAGQMVGVSEIFSSVFTIIQNGSEISIQNSLPEKTDCAITGMNGKIVYHHVFTSSQNIDLSVFSSGIYTISLSSESSVKHFRIFIHE